MTPNEFSVAFMEMPFMSPGYLESCGVGSDMSIILSGICLAYSMSRGDFVEVLRKHVGVSIEGLVSISSWEDDTDDLTGWHDPEFEGFRIAIDDPEESPENRYTNKYGQVDYVYVAYLTKSNLNKVLPYLRAVEEFGEFVSLIEERIRD